MIKNMTNFYIPGSGNSFRIKKQKLELGMNIDDMENDEKLDVNPCIPIGLSKESNENQNYKELLYQLSIGTITNHEIKHNLEEYLGYNRNQKEESKNVDIDMEMPSYFDTNLVYEVVSGVLKENRTIQSLSQSLKVDPNTIKYILSLWKRKYKKKRLQLSKANKGRRPKFGIDYLNWIENFLNSHRF